MAIPDYETLMLPVLRIGAEGTTHVQDAIKRLSDDFQLTEEETDQRLPSDQRQTLFAKRVHWAITYLKHANILYRPKRGWFEATDRGTQLLSRGVSKVDNSTLREYREFIEWIERSRKPKDKPNLAAREPAQDFESTGHGDNGSQGAFTKDELHQTPEERIESDYQSITEALRDDLIDRLISAPPSFFESVIVDLLVSMGYGGSRQEAGRALGKVGDEGIDGIINEDPLGLDIVYLQAKRYAVNNIVGRPAIQSFAGSLDGFGAIKGVFVTTSSFSREASTYADRISKRIILIDGQEMTRLMIQYGVGIRVSSTYYVCRIDEDYFGVD